MLQIRYTRNLYLRGISVVYLFAFTSFYLQIQGLYGNNGILPARTQLESRAETLTARIQSKPTLLWLAPFIGLDTVSMMEVLSLFGVLLAFTGFVSQKFCTAFTFLGLWSLYYSLYQVGQTFMWFQWDLLLLEAGLLCVLVAPLRYGSQLRRKPSGVPSDSPSDAISFWLVRWLLFRLMFSSGVVKLTSGCPTWWGLTALSTHFESQCLPTPLAWYTHHLPTVALKLTAVLANVVEIGVPLLFFVPLRCVRLVAFYIQVLLQVCIVITGNYNFFNLLTIVLCLSLVDDEFFRSAPAAKPAKAAAPAGKGKGGGKRPVPPPASPPPSVVWRLVRGIITVAVYGVLLYATYVLFDIRITPVGTIETKIAFTRTQFDWALGRAVPLTIYLGLGSLALVTLEALASSLGVQGSSKVTTTLTTLVYAVAALGLFAVSAVPYSGLHATGNATVPGVVRGWHAQLDRLHVANSYGLFRSMTGVGGRPEVVIEGAKHLEGPWLEYHFLYKPGDVNSSLAFVAPHQPRLDWQMWFAALGTYHQNPWLMSLAYRLLTGQSEVLQLIDQSRLPFPQATPPKYVRANLYLYSYTPFSQRSGPAWWTREKKAEYFPIFSRDHPPLLDYLRNLRILPAHAEPVSWLTAALGYLRQVLQQVPPNVMCWSLFATGCVLIATTGRK